MTNKGMIDISKKNVTERTATAIGTVELSPEAFEILKSGKSIKGDVLGTSKITAIGAIKSTPTLIPMCHPIAIESISIDFKLDDAAKTAITNVTVKATAKTGVEMEALAGASAACLNIYDMLKYTGKEMIISQVKLLEKTGGKSGEYKRKD